MKPRMSMITLLTGVAIGFLLAVLLDISGLRLKEALEPSAQLEISNSMDDSVSVQVRDSVLFQGPVVSAGGNSSMRLPHIGLYEVSASRPDGKVFAKQLVSIDDSRKAYIVVQEETIVESHQPIGI